MQKDTVCPQCGADGVRFTLQERDGRFMWIFPDGSPTGVAGATPNEVRRAMMYRAADLARDYSSRHEAVEDCASGLIYALTDVDS